MKTHILAIVGASGSGKTTVANQLLKECQSLGYSATLISQDNFYNPVGHPLSNYDEPEALELNLLLEKLTDIKSGSITEIPTYDFVTHRRLSETLTLEPTDVLIVEGLFLLSDPALVSIFDTSIYLNVDQALCFERRLKRDQQERGRDPSGIERQYLSQVKPGFEKHIKPFSKRATLIIDQLPNNVTDFIKKILDNKYAQ